MMNTLKNIIKRTIDMKYQDMQEINFGDMTQKEKAEHEGASNEYSKLEGELKKTLTEEQWSAACECMDAFNLLNAIEQDYMFNRGVKAGLNELSFIREEMGSNIVIL